MGVSGPGTDPGVPGGAEASPDLQGKCGASVEVNKFTEMEDSDSMEEMPKAEQPDKKLKTVFRILRTRPRILIISVAVLVLLLVPSMVGLVVARDKEIDSRKSRALEGSCLEASNGIESKLDSIFNGVRAMVSWVRNYPNCTELEKSFANISHDIRNFDGRTDLFQLEADVAGHIWFIEPPVPEDLNWLYGYNMLNEELVGDDRLRRNGLLGDGTFTFDGPAYQPDGFFGGYAIYSVYLPAESPDVDLGCDYLFTASPSYSDLTYDPVSKKKFWGLIQGMVNLQSYYDGTDTVLRALADEYLFRISISSDLPVHDYNYKKAGNDIIVTDPPPKDPVSRTISYENMKWIIEISPEGGWSPNWFAGCIAAIIIGSVLISLLVCWGLIVMELQKMSNLELEKSLAQLADTTSKLQEEKHATDELVKRQLKLIACLEGSNNHVVSNKSVTDSVLDRIEDVRRGMKPTTGASGTSVGAPSDEIIMVELLGEGSYGKVYKGMWKNSLVAIKSIILPANMSGAAKREKMAVMEAAISSSLSHPNIVQTYTYDIMKHEDSSTAAAKYVVTSSASASPSDKSTKQAASNSFGKESVSNAAGVWSLEVRIVLEYCDKGSLRAALDRKIFQEGAKGTRYLYVIDTAADIARGMLHLHHSNVLHGDLKSVNVLMKSDGSEGRGFVAKIADFGLSVHIDQDATHMSNVFHGTLTHMSPEVLLKGQVGKKTDVYAFGITMWELLTGSYPFHGMPIVTVGHGVAKKRWRPKWPVHTPLKYRLLAEQCWSQSPEDRPTFQEIVENLREIRTEVHEDDFLQIEQMDVVDGIKARAPVKKTEPSLDLSQMMGCTSASAAVPMGIQEESEEGDSDEEESTAIATAPAAQDAASDPNGVAVTVAAASAAVGAVAGASDSPAPPTDNATKAWQQPGLGKVGVVPADAAATPANQDDSFIRSQLRPGIGNGKGPSAVGSVFGAPVAGAPGSPKASSSLVGTSPLNPSLRPLPRAPPQCQDSDSVRSALRPQGGASGKQSSGSTPTGSAHNSGARLSPLVSAIPQTACAAATQSLDIFSVMKSLKSGHLCELMEEDSEEETQS